jgi:hypothetical protein
MGSQLNPITHKIQIWLKEVVRWEFRSTKLHIDGLWFSLKGIARRDFRLTQPKIKFRGWPDRDIRITKLYMVLVIGF